MIAELSEAGRVKAGTQCAAQRERGYEFIACGEPIVTGVAEIRIVFIASRETDIEFVGDCCIEADIAALHIACDRACVFRAKACR